LAYCTRAWDSVANHNARGATPGEPVEDRLDGDAVSDGSASAAPAARTVKRESVRLFYKQLACYIWIYPVVVLPFLGLLWFEGSGLLFRSGGASFFACCAIVATIGENLVQQWQEDCFRRIWWPWPSQAWKWLKTGKGADRFERDGAEVIVGATSYVVILIPLIWNAYYAWHDHAAVSPKVDWVQVLPLVTAFFFLPQARFAFTANQLD
jgi:hypothetical protein